MKKVITQLLAFSLLFLIFVSCDTVKEEYQYSYAPSFEEDDEMTRYDAITIAKQDAYVQRIIANCYGLKFFYAPDYSTCTATKNGDDWEVTLKGTISGYTDAYKSDYVYDKNFIVKVNMSADGNICDALVST